MDSKLTISASKEINDKVTSHIKNSLLDIHSVKEPSNFELEPINHDDQLSKRQSSHPRFLRSSTSQLTILGIIFFLGPGMFSALNGLGGAGLGNPVPGNTANVAVYAALAIVGFFAGPIVGKLGFQLCSFLGAAGYVIYAASLLCFKETGNAPFLIFAGSFLGVVSSLLWTAQGAMVMSYPTPESKGKFIFFVWGIFNLGAAIGSLIVFAQSINSKANGISNPTYYGFIAMMLFGVLLTLLICKKEHVLGVSQAPGNLPETLSWWREIQSLLYLLKTDTYIITLFPMFFVSNYYYPYQFNDINLATFNIRTRALNNSLYWAMQIPGSLLVGYLLDLRNISRRLKAKVAFFSILLLTLGTRGGGYAWQRNYTRKEIALPSFQPLDFKDSNYGGPLVLFMSYGLFDAIWQSYIYWLLGAISKDIRNAADLAGFYKGIQSAGAAVAFRINIWHNSFMADFLVCWIMLLGSLAVAAPVIFTKIHNIEKAVDEVIVDDRID
ncbi:hypothetical protein B7494_g5192 [Chlorociboria aeruginascens]|nr:hypothetical protein B7494_g5192 [Chlorociboria aeruginascens]